MDSQNREFLVDLLRRLTSALIAQRFDLSLAYAELLEALFIDARESPPTIEAPNPNP